MKKAMFFVLMAAAATTTFAQDDIVKQAKKDFGKGNFDAALQALKPALDNAATEDKAAAWNLVNDIYYKQFEDAQNEGMQAQITKKAVNIDTLKMYDCLSEGLKAAMQANVYDHQPNAKGKVKVRFQDNNLSRYQNTRLTLINAGQWAYNKKNMANALKYWGAYVDCASDPLFANEDKNPDKNLYYKYLSEIAYYAGLVAYQSKDFVSAEKYAAIAAQDPAKAKDANEILLFSKKDNSKTHADSVAYRDMVIKLHKENPDEERFYNLLMDYYSRPGRTEEMKAWVSEELAANPDNKMNWALKGELDMNARQWDDAVASYQKAIDMDPSFVQCVFNAGVCLNSKAIDLKDQLADKATGKLTKANADKVKAILAQAKEYLERAKQLDPDREKVNWAYPLYQIYYSLGDQANAAEMEKLVSAQ
ncbi:MAG: hypothetical protein K5928_01120 [Prevotella sp.]|nr:hypothetical protein [Prevotella sp.]